MEIGFIPKVVETNHYHLWTDALHARALSHQTSNKWDCGSYVRWTVVVGWTVLEIACQDALDAVDISYSFRKNFDKAVEERGLVPVAWGSGIWQRVANLLRTRNCLVHPFAKLSDMFPEPAMAAEAIDIIREGVRAVCELSGKPVPEWIEDDDDKGWTDERASWAHATKIWAGVSADDPLATRVSYVCASGEYESDIMPPDADFEPVIYRLLRGINVPIRQINVRRGDEVIHTVDVNMRGA